MEHPFYVVNDKGETIPIRHLPYFPSGFRLDKDGKTFIGLSCNRRDPIRVDNTIRELRSELEKYGYSVIAGNAPKPEDDSISGASGMFGGELLG